MVRRHLLAEAGSPAIPEKFAIAGCLFFRQ